MYWEVKNDANGHGRGLYAICDIQPGTVVLTEKPFLPCVEVDPSISDDTLHVSLARSIVEGNSPLPLKQLHAILDTLYPLSFKDIPQPELCLQTYTSLFPSLIAAAEATVQKMKLLEDQKMEANDRLQHWSDDDMFLLLCRIRFNCFQSGLYRVCSYLNHNCKPTCAKFQHNVEHKNIHDHSTHTFSSNSKNAQSSVEQITIGAKIQTSDNVRGSVEGMHHNLKRDVAGNNNQDNYSPLMNDGDATQGKSIVSFAANQIWTEIVATSFIRKGEEINISYFGSIDRSHGYRSNDFYRSHLCHLGPSPFPAELEALCTPVRQKSSIIADAENKDEAEGLFVSQENMDQQARLDLEYELDNIHLLSPEEAKIEMQKHLLKKSSQTSNSTLNWDRGSKIINQLKTIHTQAKSLYDPKHLVMLRIDRLFIAYAMDILANAPTITEAVSLAKAVVERGVRPDFLQRLELVFGPHHCDLASVFTDISTCLEFLLQTDGGDKLLSRMFPDVLGSVAKASKFSFLLMKRSKAIQKLYS
jgi:hypothetical protein